MNNTPIAPDANAVGPASNNLASEFTVVEVSATSTETQTVDATATAPVAPGATATIAAPGQQVATPRGPSLKDHAIRLASRAYAASISGGDWVLTKLGIRRGALASVAVLILVLALGLGKIMSLQTQLEEARYQQKAATEMADAYKQSFGEAEAALKRVNGWHLTEAERPWYQKLNKWW